MQDVENAHRSYGTSTAPPEGGVRHVYGILRKRARQPHMAARSAEGAHPKKEAAAPVAPAEGLLPCITRRISK